MTRAIGAGFVVVAALLFTGALAQADAPPDQYGSFNQADVVVYDRFTGLTWQRIATAQSSLAGASAACASLDLDAITTWRLPSYKELLTLVDESPHIEYPTGAPTTIAIDPNAFPLTAVNAPYWSSSLAPASTGSVLAVDFSTGAGTTLTFTTGAPAYVRCVSP